MRERPWLKKIHSDLTCVTGWEKLQVPGPIPVALRQEQGIKSQWYKQESECGSVRLARGTRQRVGGCLWSSDISQRDPSESGWVPMELGYEVLGPQAMGRSE